MPADWQLTTIFDTPAASRVEGVATIATRQHGVVALWQFEAIGFSAGAVRSRVRAGALHPVHREVFAVGHRSLRREGHWIAAVLACGPGAALSHRSAAALWDLQASSATRLDVTVVGRAGRSRPGLRVHCGAYLADDEVTVRQAIPCTTVARTLLDLASILDTRGIERVCERAERIEVFDLWAVGRLLARHRGRRGVARLREVLAEWDPDLARTRSELEVLLLRLMIRAGIERPLVNVRIELPGGDAPEVDFHWPGPRLVIEADGGAFHRSPRARREDARRDRALRAAGWRVRRLTWDDVTHQPARTLQTLRTLLSSPTGS